MQDQDREKSIYSQLTALLASDNSGIGAPIRLFIFIGASIFVAEIIAMVVVYFLNPLSYMWITLIDAAVMLILIFPFLYHFSFRPLLRHIEIRQQVEEKLRQTNEDMELRVKTRTGEIRSANLALQDEVMARKQIEENLRASEERYRGLFNSMTEGFALHQILCDDSGTPYDYKFLEINPSFERLTGLRRDMTVGRTVRELLPDLEPVWIEKYGNVALTGQPVHFVDYTASLNKWYEIYCYSPERNYFAVLFFDISERKKAEDQLSYQAALLSTVDDAIIASDDQYQLTAWNSAAEILYGWKAQEVLGCNGLEIIRTVWLERDPEEMRRTIAETGRWRGEATQVRRDGTRFPVEVSSIVLHGDEGQILGYVSVNRDITERKRAEEALRQSQLDLYRAQEVGQIGSWRLDVRKNMLTWSDENHCIFGIPKGTQMTYETFLSTIHPEDRSYVDEKWNAALRGEPYDIEHRIIVDEKIKWVREKAYLEFDGENNLKGGFGISQDISERKRAAELIERSNQRLNEILASIQDDFYVLDRNWNFSYASRLFTSKIGKEPEDFVGKNIWQMFPKHLGTELEENFRAAMELREVRRFEVGGRYTNAWYRMTVFPSADGITVLGTDISERRQAEAALQKSEALLRAVLDQMPSGVTVREAVTGKLILSNTRSREILENVAENTDQLAKYRGFHADGNPYRHEEWPVFRSMVSGEKVDAEEIEFERGSGTHITISMSSAPIRDMQGEIISGVAVFHDITERKKAERELQQLNRTLRAHSAANQAVLRAKTEDELLNEVCKIVVEDCGYAMVWIGYAEDDDEKTVRPVANAGFEEGYIETLNINWSDTERGRGPTGTAIRTGKPQSCRNMLIDPQFAPWREQALQRGYASSIVLPLIIQSKSIGALTIYSRQPDAFSQDEEKLLIDLSTDLAHGIEMIRLREDHERTTAALRESEERFRLALSHAPVTVAVQDLDMRYTWVYNQRTRFATEIIGRTDFDLFPAEAEHLTSLKRRVLETGERLREQLWITSNNQRLFLDVFIEPLKNEIGEIEGIGLASVDLTAIKLAEEALRESEAKYRNLFENMTEEVHFWKLVRDEDGGIKTWQLVDANPPSLKSWGKNSINEIRGKTTEQIFGPGATQHYKPIVQKIMTENISYSYEDYFPNLDKYFRFTSVPLGEYFITTGADITMIKKAEQALRQAHDELEIRVQARTAELAAANLDLSNEIRERMKIERELRVQTTAMEAAADGIVITDPQGSMLWVNPALRSLSGYSRDELIGQNMRLFKSGLHDQAYYQHMWANILTGIMWQGETINRRKDGSLYVEEQTIAPVRDERGKISHFIAIKHDITEQKQAKAELEQRNQELQALSETERKQRQLAETLRTSAQALTQSLDLDTVINTLLKQVRALVGADTASAILPEGETHLGIRAVDGFDGWTDPLKLMAIKVESESHPIFRRLLSTHRTLLIPDTTQEPDWVMYPGLEPIHNELYVPVTVEDRMIGIVDLGKFEANYFTEEHVQWAEALTGQAAIAIQNAWLFEQVRAGRERLQFLSRRLVEIQESERRYIARELHDHAGQNLTSLMLGLGTIEKEANNAEFVHARAAELKGMTDHILEDLHRLAINLRPASLDHLGLTPALEQLIKAFTQDSHLPIRLKTVGFDEDERMPHEIETALYRVVQEALTNVVRHAKASQVDVVLERRDDSMLVIVEDDGKGFDVSLAAESGHLGLLGIRERAEMLGGTLTIESTPGSGTTLFVEVPYGNSNIAR